MIATIRILLLVLALAVAARADSGEFGAVVQIGPGVPDGVHAVSGDIDGQSFSGTLTVDVDAEGRVSAHLQGDALSVLLAGRYRRTGGFETLSLRGVGTQRKLKLKFTRVGDPTFVGKVKGGSGAVARRGELRFTLDETEAWTAELAAGTRNASGPTTFGYGTATVGQTAISVAAKVKVGRRTSRFKFVGDGFRFSGKGVLGADKFTISTFSLQTHGIVVWGSGEMGFRPNGPDVTLILSSGHNGLGLASTSRPYLSGDVGPAIEDLLWRRGRSYWTASFVDHADGTPYGDGFDGMVDTLAAVRDSWITDRMFPTRVVVIAHSHGGVRAHEATRELPDVPIAVLIDLDASSCLFKTSHALEAFVDPVSAFQIGGSYYDLEDVVFANVRYNLDVRSGESCGGVLPELYDDSSNIRVDGSFSGLWTYESHTSHSEVHAASGTTLPVVKGWLLDRLADLALLAW